MFTGNIELIIIFLILLIFFGPRLPKIAQSLGKSIQSFRDGLNGVDPANEQKETPVKTVNMDEQKSGANASQQSASDKTDTTS